MSTCRICGAPAQWYTNTDGRCARCTLLSCPSCDATQLYLHRGWFALRYRCSGCGWKGRRL